MLKCRNRPFYPPLAKLIMKASQGYPGHLKYFKLLSRPFYYMKFSALKLPGGFNFNLFIDKALVGPCEKSVDFEQL